MKKCNKCEQEKEDDQFRHNRKVCKACEKKYGREYRQNNKDKSSNWVSKNPEKMKKLQADWYAKNKVKINDKFKERYRDTKTDFKKIKNYRTAISHMIGGKQKTNKYIGCNNIFLKDWISFCFDEQMSFHNYADIWNIDHVIPIDSIENDQSNFSIITKWQNITPVLTSFNFRKNKKINKEQIMKHTQKLQQYYEIRNLEPDKEYINYLQDILLRETP